MAWSGFALWIAGAAHAAAQSPPPAGAEPNAVFAEQIRPVLTTVCWKCHGPEKAQAGLRLDSRQGLLRGGDSGPAIVPGKPDESILIRALRYGDELQMPPDEKLPQPVIDSFVAWVRAGAVWPGDEPAEGAESGSTPWSFEPIKNVEPPADHENWSANPIDRFLWAKQREAGLEPAGEAERHALLRRMSFDLTGLPPTADEVEAFVRDSSPEAWEKQIERLLASPRYGERWGRHWLDVVRYADTGGFEHDGLYPNAWRYRDYVIRSFNNDKPFDRFIAEQVAGDELWPGDGEAALGTGLYCVGPVQEESTLVTGQLDNDWLIDAADTTGAAFLGLTVGCARCHNHKYDPITQQDYYSLQAIFAASDRAYSQRIRERRLKALNGVLSEVPLPEKFAHDVRCTVRTEAEAGFGLFHRPEPLSTRRLHRGELSKPREPVEPTVPAALAGSSKAAADFEHGDGRRAALAEWLIAPDHPLTARVLVNRIWGWHFGQGLVRTPNDFGKQGERPTHPELLDWLARDLIDHGWSVKHLQRRVLSSRAYRMSSVAAGRWREQDPENRLLAHFPRRRLEAEEIRDSLLACAGTLNDEAFGPPVVPPLSREELTGLFDGAKKWPVTKDASQHCRRSVYLLVRRTFAFPLMGTFDLPDTMVSCSRRNRTIVPTQALALLNSPLVQEQAAAFARRVRTEADRNREAAIARAWLLAFGRPASDAEIARAAAFLRDRSCGGADAPHPAAEDEAWEELCLALFNSNEFVYVD